MKSLKIGMLFLITGMLTNSAFGQNTDWIWRPVVSYSWKSSDQLSYSTKLEMFNSVTDFDNQEAIQYIEPQFSFSYSLSPRVKLGGGFYSRWVDPLYSGYAYEQRLLQQIGFVTYLGDRRIAHRARIEQRFRNTNYLNRFRYQLSYDFPLQGDRLDPGENYILMYNDAMVAFNKSTFSGENRAGVGLGWYFNSKRKFELGFSYRTKNIFTDRDLGHVLLLNTLFYFNR
ncbi:MAG: DUF2490 domain-containing protein [Gracilimonas sp.]